MNTILLLALACGEKEDTAQISENTQETAAEMNDTNDPNNNAQPMGGTNV